jgi:hypothetical protein
MVKADRSAAGFTIFPVEFAKPAVTHTIGVLLLIFLPHKLEV